MVCFIDFVGTPKGAKIFVDEVEIGELPKYVYPLKWGKYQIRVSLEGYVDEIRKDYVIFPTDRSKKVVIALVKSEEA